MSQGRLEIFVEPFKENDPGPHVFAVINSLNDAGFETDMGPFATSAEGDLTELLTAVHDAMAAGFAAGATAIQLRVERP